jgi:hypothetical protein
MTDAAFRAVIAAVVVAAGAIAYSNSLGNDWVWDDVSSVLLHEHVQDPSRWHRLFVEDQHAFVGRQGNFYRPLVALSFGIDFALAHGGVPAPGPEGPPNPVPDVDPALFHVTSTLWHLAAALGLLAIMALMRAPRFVQAIVPVLYVVHPLHTEAVTYISGRADQMSGAFMFWGVAVALLPAKGGARIATTLGAALLGACAVLSKESGAMFPILLLIVAGAAVLMHPEAHRRTRFHELTPSVAAAFAVLAAYVAVRVLWLNFGSDSTPPEGGLTQRIIETGQSLALYAKLMIVPTHLHMERTLDWVPASLGVVGWVLLGTLVLGIVAGVRRGEYRIALGLAWFAATWFPISGLIPLNAPMAEHWLYVPMAGLLWAVFEALHRATPEPGQRALVGVLAAAATVVFIGMTLERNRDWADNETLFRATLRENPRSLRVHYNLAITYETQLNEPQAAIRHFERVVELYAEQKERAGNLSLLWPEELDSHLSLGNLYLEQGRINEAGRHFTAAARGAGDPQFAAITATAAFGLARCMVETGNPVGAVQQIQQALRIRPDLGPSVRRTLAGRLPGLYS